MTEPILQIQNLSMAYSSGNIELPVLRDINLEIQPAQIYGLVGESGSGKTTLGLAIMRYLAAEGRITSGSIQFGSRDLLALSKSELRQLWGKEISLVPQDPYSSLNPSLRIGEQLSEIFRVHNNQSKSEADILAIKWLEKVRLPDPQNLIKKYPHELSGGQKQRILVAMALSTQPKLLVLDEPTTSLDVTTEAVVLDLLRNLIRDQGTSVLYITHNLGIVAGLTDRVAVLYSGELVEDSPTELIYSNPLHPYTIGLLNSVPKLGIDKNNSDLAGIPGQIHPPGEIPSGCVFTPRCPVAINICSEEHPLLESPGPGRSVRCFRWQEIHSGKIIILPEINPLPKLLTEDEKPILQIEDLKVEYKTRSSGLNSLLGRKQSFKAVDKVSLEVTKTHTLGIVGESGSGKSSLALAVMGLVNSSAEKMSLFDIRLPHNLSQRDQIILQKLQMVFQNLDEAFSPFLTIEEILSRPLLNLLGLSKSEARTQVSELLKMVHLPVKYASRYPRQLSGGEKQRVAIAQAFASSPNLLLADEPVSALDVSVQANILNLLNDLQRDNKTSMIFISHYIAVVTYLADEIAVMYLGQIMQFSDNQDLLLPPYHPYTEALLSAIPTINTNLDHQIIRLEGDIVSPLEKPAGCPFHSRCPRVIGEICKTKTPPWQETSIGKKIFCHIPISDLQNIQKPVVNIENTGPN